MDLDLAFELLAKLLGARLTNEGVAYGSAIRYKMRWQLNSVYYLTYPLTLAKSVF